MKTQTTYTIREVLHGLKPGTIQTVGVMQVVPLILEVDENSNFAAPRHLLSGAPRNYGSMEWVNRSDKIAIIPSHAAVLTKSAVQDHAMSRVGLVKGGSSRTYDNAMCVQRTQGGHMSTREYPLQVLPYALRGKALNVREQRSFDKLWASIGRFNAMANVSDSGGHLVYFVEKYGSVLDQFVAEFEIVPRQVGAIIIVDGKLLGVERAPNLEYWEDVFEPLIRLCYGSQAVLAAMQKDKKSKSPKKSYSMIRENIADLDDLELALKEADASLEQQARQIVRDLIDDPFETKLDDDFKQNVKVWNVNNDQFEGEIVTEDGIVAYASLVAKMNWDKKKSYRNAPAFSL